MLGKISHWLATRHDDKGGASDAFVQQRYDALTRLKNATLAVLRKENAAELGDAGGQQTASSQQPGTGGGLAAVALPREQRQQLTERDPCVGELCVALEACLVLGLKPRSTEEQPSWWHVLYASTLIVDEPTLVQSVLSAAFLSEEDAGKARCWLKIALNNHTIESSIMMIFSMACEHLIRNNYEEWSLVRCSEGLGLFLELVIALRDVHFAIEVSGDPFHLPEPAETVEVEPVVAESSSGEMVATITDADIAAAVGVSPSRAGSFLPPPDAEPVFVEFEDAIEVKDPEIQGVVTTDEDEEEVIQLPSALFPHRLRGIKPWQYVFGISLASLSKNPYHSRYALIDPFLALPNIVDDCVTILRENPDTPRLFRTTVLSIRLNQLREIVETEGSVPKDLDPQCAGALLLDFLKNLPDSLLTDDKYDAFVAAGQLRDEEASVRNITCLVNDLPVHCQIVLKRLINLMHFLQQPEHSELNGVDVFTASTVIAPVIAFKKGSGSGLLSERQRGRAHSQYQDVRYAAVGAQVVERMIQHYASIFHNVRIQVVDALERLEAKKEALRMVSHQLKLLPQMNFMSDRQQVNEVTRLFREHLEGGNNSLAGQVAECSTPEVTAEVENESQSDTPFNLELDLWGSTAATPHTSATSSDASSPTTSETTEQDLVSMWEQFGFNRPTILGNFEKGGVLMLRAILYWLNNDSNALALLKMRALPSELPSYDAGLVASSICEALVKLLKLFLTPKHPEIDIVAMSLEPFWELFDEDMYFNKLFMFMFQVFDQLWSELDPKAASFTRVITETEGIMNELLKKAPVTVSDLQAEWAEIRARRLEETEDDDGLEQEELIEDEVLQAAALSDPSLLSPPLRYSKKKPSFDVRPDDYKSKLMDTSSILTLEHIAYIDHALPITSQLCRWFRIYSIEANGSSLETLLILAQKQSPTLLVVKDADGNVFGGFASDEWHRAFHYYGTGESFLFSFANSSTAGGFVKYQWSRKNSYFMLCSDESLIMGGGGNFGLFLDSDLSRGSSGACETYNSPPLTTSQDFSCVHVELWGFTTGDKPEIERHRKSVLD
ncbi:hypothetical protein PF005_g3817 [Phytophthora fragariae]|uniref:Oxidation resistance protein 1 n=1 Tax=Phytophthora fragariae TaxID=53985 RepID=A0A6A4EWR5_9STRA|nr:hypothetical protein PF003_g23392 [Phytophthora fragariae]KAE8946196.1 hypothetical protein PF009_g4158 [Phytophthora fragariae]KAE9025483.1 hypothetical protein PF011_g3009 [Phytophthora fragariae]KAE9132284.1 hypothetical protein PF007_g3789 [Phytophthora fragariae]KAE9229562.1 hypothetical protein PF005_g3817 [Phytophthora fragariae]